jgi:two-component system sensor histidine kinase KdpD
MSKAAFRMQKVCARFGMLGLRIFGAFAAVAGVTVVCANIFPISPVMAGFLYLASIAVIATAWGRIEAGAASAAAFLCLGYFFFPPVKSFALIRPATIEGLFGFLAAALTVLLLAPRPPVSEDSIDRQSEMESLYALSRAILLMDSARPVAKQIAYQVAQIFKFPAVVLYDRVTGETLCAGPEDMPGIEDKLRKAAVLGTLFQDRCDQTVVAAVRLGGDPIASIAVRGATTLSDSALQALTNLVAIGLERARGQEAAHRADVARQTQELKSTLLDAIAHEFKTPLTSIKAAATALLSGSFNKVLEQRELARIVDEEADRLSRLVSDAIQMARLEGAKNEIARELHPVCDLVDAALGPIRTALDGRELLVNLENDVPLVMADAELVGLAIRQLLDHALKYALPHTPIAIHATTAEGKAFISVSDQEEWSSSRSDQDHETEKSYLDSWNQRQVAGGGTGLAIARKIVEVHGGEIRIASRRGEANEVVIALPAAAQHIPA